jgi:Tol biopolymer transport system component
VIDQQNVERAAERFRLPEGSFERLAERRDRKRRNQRIRAGVLGIAIAVVVGWWGIHAIASSPPKPAVPPEPSVDLGIFEPVAGRIVYSTDSSLWGADPNAPSPGSTLVRIDLGGTDNVFPLGWSSDGTELLFERQDPADSERRYLYILHADGTETQVTPDTVGGAAISPDGSRVVFADERSDGLYVVDAEGGQPVRIAEGEEPTFSPDGTQIAYLGLPRSGCCVRSTGREHVWVANADGTDAHEILADEPALAKGVFGLAWSPAGDHIAMENTLGGHVAIYTFAPDGSEFREVIPSGGNPYWSPDGSQIAYVVLGSSQGLQIADADGSNIRSLGFGSSGPWHPGTGDAP